MRRLYYALHFILVRFRRALDCVYYRYVLRVNWNSLEDVSSSFICSEPLGFVALITRWLQENITYEDKEHFDYPQVPEVFLHKRRGNCNDYAYCILAFLKRYKPYVPATLLIVNAKNWRGHAVCVFELKEGMLHASNAGLDLTRYATYAEIATALYENWDEYLVVTYDLSLIEVVRR